MCAFLVSRELGVKKPTTFTTKLPKNKANCQTGELLAVLIK
jgi:hypothetical protein